MSQLPSNPGLPFTGNPVNDLIVGGAEALTGGGVSRGLQRKALEYAKQTELQKQELDLQFAKKAAEAAAQTELALVEVRRRIMGENMTTEQRVQRAAAARYAGIMAQRGAVLAQYTETLRNQDVKEMGRLVEEFRKVQATINRDIQQESGAMTLRILHSVGDARNLAAELRAGSKEITEEINILRGGLNKPSRTFSGVSTDPYARITPSIVMDPVVEAPISKVMGSMGRMTQPYGEPILPEQGIPTSLPISTPDEGALRGMSQRLAERGFRSILQVPQYRGLIEKVISGANDKEIAEYISSSGFSQKHHRDLFTLMTEVSLRYDALSKADPKLVEFALRQAAESGGAKSPAEVQKAVTELQATLNGLSGDQQEDLRSAYSHLGGIASRVLGALSSPTEYETTREVAADFLKDFQTATTSAFAGLQYAQEGTVDQTKGAAREANRIADETYAMMVAGVGKRALEEHVQRAVERSPKLAKGAAHNVMGLVASRAATVLQTEDPAMRTDEGKAILGTYSMQELSDFAANGASALKIAAPELEGLATAYSDLFKQVNAGKIPPKVALESIYDPATGDAFVPMIGTDEAGNPIVTRGENFDVAVSPGAEARFSSSYLKGLPGNDLNIGMNVLLSQVDRETQKMLGVPQPEAGKTQDPKAPAGQPGPRNLDAEAKALDSELGALPELPAAGAPEEAAAKATDTAMANITKAARTPLDNLKYGAPDFASIGYGTNGVLGPGQTRYFADQQAKFMSQARAATPPPGLGVQDPMSVNPGSPGGSSGAQAPKPVAKADNAAPKPQQGPAGVSGFSRAMYPQSTA